jgi:hypothetical protein
MRRWSTKYKKRIDCNHPKGFSQKKHCKFGRTRKKIRRRKEKYGIL